MTPKLATVPIISIDHQPQMAFSGQSIDRQMLKNNTVALAKAAKVFTIPTTITTVETESFAGYAYPELLDVFPDTAQRSPTCLRLRSWFHLFLQASERK